MCQLCNTGRMKETTIKAEQIAPDAPDVKTHQSSQLKEAIARLNDAAANDKSFVLFIANDGKTDEEVEVEAVTFCRQSHLPFIKKACSQLGERKDPFLELMKSIFGEEAVAEAVAATKSQQQGA